MTNFHLNTTVVAIFPNVCLWRRSLCSDLVLTLKNRIEPPSYARTAYVVAIWPWFLYDSFGKIWATWEIFWGKWFTAPPGKKFSARLCSGRTKPKWLVPFDVPAEISLAQALRRSFSRWASLACRLFFLFLCLSRSLSLYSKFVDMTINLRLIL